MKSVHFMGIGGSGASAAAAIAKASGFKVSGCDKTPHNEFTANFQDIPVQTDHSPSHLKNIDILAFSPAVLALNPDNEEIKEAKAKGLETLSWQEFMAKYLQKDKFVIAVAGTHGKSTTTAMVAEILERAGLNPTVELGTVIPQWARNYRIGKSWYFISEADEFNDNYLPLHPNVAILTSVEMDHPEYFKNINSIYDSFNKFLHQTKDLIVANLADPGVRQVMETYQKDKEKSLHPTLVDYSKTEILFPLKVPGEYNRQNAAAALATGLSLGIDPKTIQESLQNYTGIGRRFEYLGKFKGADVYSDFAHHPTEIKVTAQAFREKFPDKKIWLIYQPHMFSRTKALFDEFVKVFRKVPVDQIVLIDIYTGREKGPGTVNSQHLAQSVAKENVVYKNPEELKELLYKDIKAGDVVIFMGAGDVDTMARKLASND